MTNNGKDRTHWGLNFNLDEEIIEYVDLLNNYRTECIKTKNLKNQILGYANANIILSQDVPLSLYIKWSFPLRISSVNGTKSAVSCGFGHIYWRNPLWKTSFFAQCIEIKWDHLKAPVTHRKLDLLCRMTKY